MTLPAVPEKCGMCGVEIPAGLEVFALPLDEETESTGHPLEGPILALCRDCAELNDQLDQTVDD